MKKHENGSSYDKIELQFFFHWLSALLAHVFICKAMKFQQFHFLMGIFKFLNATRGANMINNEGFSDFHVRNFLKYLSDVQQFNEEYKRRPFTVFCQTSLITILCHTDFERKA